MAVEAQQNKSQEHEPEEFLELEIALLVLFGLDDHNFVDGPQ